ncbi:hypothetical protein [Candidatus Nitrosopumilus sediminis]|uniref:hypothetical protein n=1 Tax=Candidatus Nitrosopumilus sediminis TaxID=1229909 RepID=UPI001ED97BE7|nr:hypothetical protein [Candidatus Nitrosopumilus sediminis]
MEIHQKLTVVGVVLLVVTFLINYYHQENHPDIGFNYAYITGVAMLIAFSISFVMFTKNQLK